jgi:hypothetical protein
LWPRYFCAASTSSQEQEYGLLREYGREEIFELLRRASHRLTISFFPDLEQKHFQNLESLGTVIFPAVETAKGKAALCDRCLADFRKPDAKITCSCECKNSQISMLHLWGKVCRECQHGIEGPKKRLPIYSTY